MNFRFLCFPLVLGLGAFVQIAAGQAGDATAEMSVAVPSVPSRAMKGEALQLIRADVEKASSAPQLSPHESSKEALEDVVKLDPVIVREDKMPEVSTGPENPVEHLIRTGTLAEHVGKRVTSRFWMKGDKGLMLSFSR